MKHTLIGRLAASASTNKREKPARRWLRIGHSWPRLANCRFCSSFVFLTLSCCKVDHSQSRLDSLAFFLSGLLPGQSSPSNLDIFRSTQVHLTRFFTTFFLLVTCTIRQLDHGSTDQFKLNPFDARYPWSVLPCHDEGTISGHLFLFRCTHRRVRQHCLRYVSLFPSGRTIHQFLNHF